MITFLFLPAFTFSAELPEYSLDVSFDVKNAKITGVARIAVRSKDITVNTGQLKILDVSRDKERVPFDIQNGILKISGIDKGIVEIRYEGIFKNGNNVIGEKGISLTGQWYPGVEGLSVYKLKAILPEGYEAVSEAENIIKNTRNGSSEFIFDFPHPVDGISLAAAKRYKITKDTFNDIEIFAYFFHEDIELAKKYIEYTKKYLRLYEGIIGKYPYKRFSVVENFLPTGLSMPTYTLLGQDIVKLPFIVETSLGHEILHQWFGNLVYLDYEKGNWAEGITAYLADHLYEEQKGKGWEYRKQALMDYASYVNEKNEFPVREFRGRVDSPSKAIGYGKAAMIFHMLKKMAGDDVFYRSLRELIKGKAFQKASWDDLKSVFEKNYGKDMQWFFRQWLNEKGLPTLRLENVKTVHKAGKFAVSFDINQGEKTYVIDVPVTLHSGDITRKESFRVDKKINSFSMVVNKEPEKIVLDEDYDIARQLSDKEIPPVIARLIGEEKVVAVLPIDKMDIYSSAIYMLKEKEILQKEAKDVKDSDIKTSSLIIIGNDNPLIERLYGKPEIIEAGFSIVIKNNPWNANKVVAVINGRSKEEVGTAFRKIFHYGKYSALAFDIGRNIYKRTDKSGRGIAVNLMEQPRAVAVSDLKTLNDVINNISSKKIIYTGEQHDQFAHHDTQLKIIKGQHAKNKKLAIGMEMFQRPFQGALDDYIAGRISEKEFLKKSEYFKRWAFDYNLYKPILDFAREEKIPVVALNMRREITAKVSKGGLDSLSNEEKKEIPGQMDFSDNEYRDRLMKVFKMHRNTKDRNFDFFYQSQVLWDETMSMSIDEFLKKNPDYQIVVLAGSGHIQYGSGIPKRTFRRNGYGYALILSDVDMEKNIADYIFYPQSMEGVTPPRLMVSLKEEEGRVIIEGFSENSISEKAGLNIGDVILSLDNEPISSVEDMRIHLLYKKKGDTIKVKALRRRFLLGDKEMEFEVIL
ncbi:MAG: ChaN family lipoprotein [Thermodesulfovibrionales bacterium]|nr:ChaN family lipoprotein [Thermodesulfovibrionales bacterium]